MALVVYQGPAATQVYDLDESSSSTGGSFVGLSNQGATCYLNGLLQTLFMTPEFRRAIFTWNYDKEKDGAEDHCIPLQLQRLFGLLQLSTLRAVDTVALTRSFGWEGSEVFQQQDVQELTRVLFDALEETFKGTQVENIIDELYGGEMVDYLRCLDVDYQSERVDKFLDFSVAIVPFGASTAMRSLTECIEMFLRPEILDGDNKYYAEQFDRRVDAIKGLKFGRLPQIMSVQLKRFVYDFSGEEVVQKKLNDVVKFPMILDMNKYVAKRPRRLSADGMVGVEEEGNNEFELFLQEQIERLKSGRDQRETDAADGADADAGVGAGISEEPDTSSCMEDEHAPSSSAQAGMDTAGGGSGDDGDGDTVTYGSMDEEQVLQLVATKGEFVYELYAVLIHSGAISGGHYYAYIKELQSKRWYNFNDCNVTHIDEKTVQEAWGSNVSSGHGYSYTYGRGLSSANAYMLMYRKVSILTDEPPEMGSGMGTEVVTGTGTARFSLSTGPIVGDDLVPVYIKELVAGQLRAQEERKRADAELRSRLNVRVYVEGREEIVSARRTDRYADLLAKIWACLDVQALLKAHAESQRGKGVRQGAEAEGAETAEAAEGADTDVENNSMDEDAGLGKASCNTSTLCSSTDARIHPSSNSSESRTDGNLSETSSDIAGGADKTDDSAPCFDLFRLRNYNPTTHLRTDTYDYDVEGDSSLESLQFNDYRAYALDIRVPHEQWEVYYLDGLSLLVAEFDAPRNCFLDPVSLRLPKYSTLAGLAQLVGRALGCAGADLRFHKITNVGFNDAKVETLQGPALRLREDLGLYDGYRVFAEIRPPSVPESEPAFASEPVSESASPSASVSVSAPESAPAPAPAPATVYDAYVTARNRLSIRVNRPPSVNFDIPLQVDGRWTVQQLRAEVAKELGLESEDLRLFKQSLRGQELRNGELSLSANSIYMGLNVAVGLGKATPVGYFNLLFVQYTPLANEVGVHVLPDLDEEMEEVEEVEEVCGGNFKPVGTVEDLDEDGDDAQVAGTDSSFHVPISGGYGHEYGRGGTDSGFEAFETFGGGGGGGGSEDAISDRSGDGFGCNSSVASNEGVADASEAQYFGEGDDDTFDDFQVTAFAEAEPVMEGVDMDPDLDMAISMSMVDMVMGGVGDMYGGDSSSAYLVADVLEVEAVVPLPQDEASTLHALKMEMSGSSPSMDSAFPLAQADSPLKASSLTSSPTSATATASIDVASTVDVVPSAFGEQAVKNCTLLAQFQAVEGFSGAFAQNSTTIEQLKQEVVRKLALLGKLPADTSLHRIRLRDKMGNNPGRILTGNRTFSENQIYLFDHKTLAFQVLDEEELLPDSLNGDVVVHVQMWERSSWTLGRRIEVLLRGTSTVRDIARGLSALTGVPLHSMLAMVVPKETEFLLSELAHKSPKHNYGRGWFDPTHERRLLRLMSHEMRLQEGDVLLLQDCSEPLMELTAADLKSMEIVEAAGSLTYLDFWSRTDGGHSEVSGPVNVAAAAVKPARGGAGIRIKTHRERLQEQERAEAEVGVGGSRSAGHTSPVSSSSSPPPLEDSYGGQLYSDGADAREFQKHGGFALFSDIS